MLNFKFYGLTDITKKDTDWVPMEIRYAVDSCDLPVLAVYPGYNSILDPSSLNGLWPKALASRINNSTADVIHFPFAKDPLMDAISQFSIHTDKLEGALNYYSKQAHLDWKLLKN